MLHKHKLTSKEFVAILMKVANKFIIFTIIVALGIFGFIAYDATKTASNSGIELNPLVEKIADKTPKIEFPLGIPINIMLLGIDRRARNEIYRTDVMILLSINPQTNQATLSSIPRDLWYNDGRINAVFYNQGWEEFQKAVFTYTGQNPERYILTDFRDFSWLVDAMGGVPVTVENSFTDSEYPVDATKGYQTVSFVAGNEKLTGERALIYARSRHGNNGEGSDWARMKRQHLILKGMLTAVSQPESLFNPMIVENAFKMVTENRMDTNLVLSDARYLWDFYKDKDKYTIHSLFLDYDYLYSPPPSEYGGAWVLVSKTGDYTPFHTEIGNKLFGLTPVMETTTFPETDY